jgi:diguanylate cyclase (GGDEF)-like protein
MNYNSIVPLFAAIAYVPLCFILLTNRPWKQYHRLFFIYLLTAMLWSISGFLLRSDFFPEYKELFFKFTICSVTWVFAQFLHFIRHYLYRSIEISVYLAYAIFAAMVIFCSLGYIPESISFANGTVAPTFGYWIFLVVFAPLMMLPFMIYHLIHKFIISTDPMERNRIFYFLIGIAIVAVMAMINITPVGEKFPIGQAGHLINASILIYATLKFRILDMNVLLRRSMVYASMIVIFILVFSAWYLIIFNFFKLELDYLSVSGVLVLSALSAAAFWAKARIYLYAKADELFYGESYDYRKQLSEFLTKGIGGIFNLDELANGILPPLAKVLDCGHIYMLLPERGTGDYNIDYFSPQEKNKPFLQIKQKSPVTSWLIEHNSYLSSENLEIKPEFHGLWEKEKKEIQALNIRFFFPLTSRGKLVGIIAIDNKKNGKYALEHTNMVENISSQIAISVEKEYMQQDLRRQEQELSLINKLAGVITSSLNIQEVYEVFIAGLRKVIDIDFASVMMIEESNVHFSALSSEVGSPWHTGEIIPIPGTPSEWILKYKKSLLEPDLDHDSMFNTGEELISRGIKSIIYLPLVAKGDVIGNLTIASCKRDAYSPPQVLLLERLASQISTSIANAQLYSKAEQRARVDELTGLFNRRHFDENISLEIGRHSRYGSVFSIAFLDLDNFKTYNDTMGHTMGDKLLTHIGQVIKSSLRNIDLAFRYGGDEFAILMPHTSSDDAFAVSERVRSKIYNPGRGTQILITVSIGVASWPGDGLKADDVVDAADRALYHAKRTGGNRTCLVSQLLPAADESLNSVPAAEKETLNTIYALAATIEARDPYTYGHSRKVRAYAVSLAEALNLPSEKVAAVGHAALLHDIGKIGIIDDILKKNGSLDAREWEEVKTHPQLSKTIVGHIASLTPCLPAILHHHERWDGKGYPSGLKGESIPIEARILSIADAFDAMTSLRPYRTPLTYKDAIGELKKNSGIQFDPALVKKFIPIGLTINPEEFDFGDKPVSTEAD